jgi:hypothetical protein
VTRQRDALLITKATLQAQVQELTATAAEAAGGAAAEAAAVAEPSSEARAQLAALCAMVGASAATTLEQQLATVSNWVEKVRCLWLLLRLQAGL